jgi:hypothetical protein
LLGGSKIQVGVVIVFNSGEVVDLVTRIFEVELSSGATSGSEFTRRHYDDLSGDHPGPHGLAADGRWAYPHVPGMTLFQPVFGEIVPQVIISTDR